METQWGSPELEERLARSGFWQALQHSFIEFLAPPPLAHVLDVECGAGQMARLWSGRTASVVGIDRSGENLRVAEAQTLEQTTSNLSFRIGTPDALPFKDDSFDVVSALHALPFTADPGALMLELTRVLRGGGVFGGLVPSKWISEARMERYLAQQPDPAAELVLRSFYAVRPEGFTERYLERLLTGVGLRSVRTIEQADGLLWIVKGWR